MTSVEAQFKYSYVYEGKTISFRKGELFQLLKKVNSDWWQVKRKLDNGDTENIYVPANYMKEVDDFETQSHTYQNMAELKAEYLKAKGDVKPVEKTQGIRTSPKVKARVTPKVNNKLGSERTLDSQPNGHIPPTGRDHNKPPQKCLSEPQYAVPDSPLNRKKNSNNPPVSPTHKGPIANEWQPGYSLPQTKKGRSLSLNDSEQSSLDVGIRNVDVPSAISEKPSNEVVDQRQRLAAVLDKQLLMAPGPGQVGSQNRQAPAPKPKPKSNKTRPKSYCIDDQTPTEPSTFTKRTMDSLERSVSPTGQSWKKSSEMTSSDRTNVAPKGFQLPKPTISPINTSTPVISTSSPSPVSPMPDGWSEHKAPDGKTYYYNSLTKESQWTIPTCASLTSFTPEHKTTSPVHKVFNGSGSSPKTSPKKKGSTPLERVAPRGWTKEINPLTQTPLFTNCRSGEKWVLASDENGFFYYNMADTSSILRDLPPLEDDTNESLYDHLSSVLSDRSFKQQRKRTSSENAPDPLSSVIPSVGTRGHTGLEFANSLPPGLTSVQQPNPVPSGLNSSQQLDLFSQRFSQSVLSKHGYLLRKRVYDANNKKLRNDKWVKLYVCLQENQLVFYNDHRTKDLPGAKPIGTFNLLHSNICCINYKDKKRNVIQVTSSLGEKFFLDSDTVPMMNDWYSTIQATIDRTNEDYKKHPEKYAALVTSTDTGDRHGDSPPTQSKFPHRKPSNPTVKEFDDIEMIEQLSGAEKTVRIKGRLRNLIARRPQLEALKKTGIMQEPVFGCELSELVEREHRAVPLFLEHFIDHIEKKGLNVVGLYRLSGNAASVQKLRYLVEENPFVDLTGPEWSDINIVTGCLKLYFRELPNPLIPFKLYRNFIDAARSHPPEKRVAALTREVNSLPEPNYKILKVLIKHLSRVVEFGHVNKMEATNLGIVFGPTLMRSEVDSLEMATYMPVQNNIVETIIKEHQTVFKK